MTDIEKDLKELDRRVRQILSGCPYPFEVNVELKEGHTENYKFLCVNVTSFDKNIYGNSEVIRDTDIEKGLRYLCDKMVHSFKESILLDFFNKRLCK